MYPLLIEVGDFPFEVIDDEVLAKFKFERVFNINSKNDEGIRPLHIL